MNDLSGTGGAAGQGLRRSMARSRKGQRTHDYGSSGTGSTSSGSSAPSDLYRAAVVGSVAPQGDYSSWNSSDDYRFQPIENVSVVTIPAKWDMGANNWL
jgi:hypothetical protein